MTLQFLSLPSGKSRKTQFHSYLPITRIPSCCPVQQRPERSGSHRLEDSQATGSRADPNNPEKVERYQAEALIHRDVAGLLFAGIGCYDSAQENAVKTECNQCSLSLRVIVKPGWFF